MLRDSLYSVPSPAGQLALRVCEPDDELIRPAIVIAHGAQGCKEQFSELAGVLAQAGWRVFVPDMRGHGASDGPRYHVEMADWVADVRLVLDWLLSQPAVNAQLIGGFGFSSGGTAILEAALLDARLKALVTLDATVRTVIAPWEEAALRALGWAGGLKRRWFGTDLHLPLYPFIRHRALALDPQVNRALLDDPDIVRSFWRYPVPGALDSLMVDTLSRVHDLCVPVCVLHGAEDAVDLPASAQLLFEALAGEKALFLLSDCGHAAHLDRGRAQVAEHALVWFARHLPLSSSGV